MTSINDIARMAGVSKSTVSKVLNQYDSVSDQTRRKVEQAVRALNYVPNAAAISLSKKNFHRVGLIVDMTYYKQAVDEIDILYLFGAFEKAGEYQMEAVTFFTSQFAHMSGDDMIRYLKSQGITGIIVYSLARENVKLYNVIMSKEFKAVVVDSPIVSQMISSVSVDHYKGQYEVAKKAVESGTGSTVLYIACGPDGYMTDARLAAMRRLKEERNLELIVEYADYSEKKAREITFARGREADVIVCASDLMAIGAACALEEMGVRRPVSGYDGITLMGYMRTPMYTLKQDFKKISSTAFLELVLLFEGGTGRHVTMEAKVVQIFYKDVMK